ncbi:LamG-like jellyroll fold domain-containing protein, partial [Allomuricauda taeanensis]|uniref:DUF6923 family protein n=1 Tax=Flagellimonas taeanensis TaxID=1005926 RepID=UPI002E7AEF30
MKKNKSLTIRILAGLLCALCMSMSLVPLNDINLKELVAQSQSNSYSGPLLWPLNLAMADAESAQSINDKVFEELAEVNTDFKMAHSLFYGVSDCLMQYISTERTQAVWSFDNTLNDEVGNHNPQNNPNVSYVPEFGTITETAALVLDGTTGVRYDNGAFMTEKFDELSMGFWIKPESKTSSQNRIIFEEGDRSAGLIVRLMSDGELRISFKGSSNTIDHLRMTFPDDLNWHHIAFTYINNRNVNGLATAYLDGEVQESVITGLGTIPEHVDGGGFGSTFNEDIIPGNNDDVNFKGLIDEVFYSREFISGGNILQYYQCTLATQFKSDIECPSEGFQSADGSWSSVNIATGAAIPGIVIPLINDIDGVDRGIQLNAAGYNDADGLIYSMSVDEENGDNIVMVVTEISDTRASKDGKYTFTNHRVAPIVPNGTFDPRLNYNTGDIYDNRLFIKNFTESIIHVINVDKSSKDYLSLEKSISLSEGIKTSDMAIEPNTGTIYTVDDTFARLYKIDRENGVVTNLGSVQDIGSSEDSSFGAQFIDPNGFLYVIRNDDGSIYKINLNDVEDGLPPKAVFLSQSVQSIKNDGARCHNVGISMDFGDAPESYGIASHFVNEYNGSTNTSSLMIGFKIDIEDNVPDFATNQDATGDDKEGVNDEDGVSGPIIVSYKNPEYSLQVLVTNDTGVNANLYGWIDLNGNGIFDDTEVSRLDIPTNELPGTSKIYELKWSLPFDMANGSSFLRLRLTTDELLDTDSSSADTRASQIAGDGEIEDYQVQLIACGVGNEAPDLSDVSSCEETTFDFTSLTPTNAPDGENIELTWHTGTPATDSNLVEDATAVAPGTYYAAFHDREIACYSAEPTEVVFTINDLPVAVATIADSGTSCLDAGGTITLSSGGSTVGTEDNPVTYKWTYSENDGDEMSDVGTGATLDVSEAGTYTLTVTNTATGCTDDASVTIYAVPTVNVTAEVTSELTCEVDTITLSSEGSSSGDGISYSWTGADGELLGTGATLDVTEAGTYTLTVTDSVTGCHAQASVAITQDDTEPTAVINEPDTSCLDAGGTITLSSGGSTVGTEDNP